MSEISRLNLLPPETFADILYLLNTEDAFNLWCTGDSGLLRRSFAGGKAVLRFGLYWNLKVVPEARVLPRILLQWSNIREISLVVENSMRLKSDIVGLTIEMLPRRLQRLHLEISSPVVFLGAGQLSGSSTTPLDWNDHLPELQLLSIKTSLPLPRKFALGLPKDLTALSLVCRLYNFAPAEISMLPQSLTLLHLDWEKDVWTPLRSEKLDDVAFPTQLLNLHLCAPWALDVVPALKESNINTLRICGLTVNDSVATIKALPARLTSLTISSSPWELTVPLAAALPQHLKILHWENVCGLKGEEFTALPRQLQAIWFSSHERAILNSVELGALPRTLETVDSRWEPRELGPFVPPLLKRLILWPESESQILKLPPNLQHLSLRSKIAWQKTHFEQLPDSLRFLHVEFASLVADDAFECFPAKKLKTLTLATTRAAPFELDARLLPATLTDFTCDATMSDAWLETVFSLKSLERLSCLHAVPKRVSSKCLRFMPKSLTTLRLKFSDDLRKEDLLPHMPPTIANLSLWAHDDYPEASTDLSTSDFEHLPIPLDHVHIQFRLCEIQLDRNYTGRLENYRSRPRQAPIWLHRDVPNLASLPSDIVRQLAM